MFQRGLSSNLACECVVSLWVKRVVASASGVGVLAKVACSCESDWRVGSVAHSGQIVFAWHMCGSVRWRVYPCPGFLSTSGACDRAVCRRHCVEELGADLFVDVLHDLFLRVFGRCADPVCPVDIEG